MISELIVTSAPRGLQAGRSGFTTVCRTRGIHPDLASRLEAASGYRHVFPQGDSRNPVVFSYTSKPSSLGDVWVMSRVGDAGTDYTGRSNKIAHHIALQQSDLPPLAHSNPAAVMAALTASGGLLTRWQGDPRENTAPPQLPAPSTNPSPCQRWASITGDPGWAGILAERALNKEATWIIAPENADLLALFSEALALISPSQRWQIPFTTYSLRGDEGRWLGTVAGSPEADAAAAQKRILVIDLTRRSTAPSAGPYVSAARGQANAPWHREKTVAPVRGETPTQRPTAEQTARPPDGGRAQPGLPPLLTRPHASSPAQPPGLTEWDDIELPKPRTGRLVLFVTLGLVGLVFGSLLLGYGAYRLNWLPDSLKTSLELAAWRYGIPFIDPRRPQELADALAWREQLQEIHDALINQIPRDEVEGHPALETLLYNDVPATLSSLAKQTDDKAARSAPPEELKGLAQDADNAKAFIELLRPFRESEELRKAHKQAAKMLRRPKGATPPGQVQLQGDQVTKARGALVAAAKDLQPSSIEQIRNAIGDLGAEPRPPLQPSTSPITPPLPPQPDRKSITPSTPVIGLLAKAISDRNHLPIHGLNEREPFPSFTLAEWEGVGNPASFDSVSLALPEASGRPELGCKLRKTPKQGEEACKWECYTAGEHEKLIGTFELTGTALRFRCDSELHLSESLLPFLPITITSHDSEKDISATWMQLLSPQPVDGPLVAREQEDSFRIFENTIPNTDDVLQAVVSGTPSRLVWRNCALRAKGSSTRLHLTRAAEFAFTDEAKGTPTRESLWWRPVEFAEALSPLDAFQEPIDLRVEACVKDHDIYFVTHAEFLFDNAVGEAAKKKSSVCTLLVKNARTGDKSLTRGAWNDIVTEVTEWGLILPQAEWNSMLANKKSKHLREIYPEIKGGEKQPLEKWISELQSECARGEGFADHVKAEAAATKQLREHPFHNLGERPTKGENEDDKTYQGRLAEFDKEHKKHKASYDALLVKTVNDLSSDARELVKWAAHLSGKRDGLPSGEILRLFLWLSLYKYHVAHEHSFISDDRLQNKNNEPPLSNFASVCKGGALLISGEVELDWSHDFPQLQFEEKDTPRVRLVQFPAPPAEAAAAPANASQRTATETGEKVDASASIRKEGID